MSFIIIIIIVFIRQVLDHNVQRKGEAGDQLLEGVLF